MFSVAAALLLLLCRLVSSSSPSGLTLAVYNSTALSGHVLATRTVPGLSFVLPAGQPTSAEITGVLISRPGDVLSISCEFSGATLAMLHIDDHLVCQHGANAGAGCRTDNHLCNGTDSPLTVRSRTNLPVRLALFVNESRATPIDVRVQLKLASGRAPSFSPALPPLEVQRRVLQKSLLQGWGLFYDMSYLDHVLLPQAARVKLAICETAPRGNNCLEQGRIDWPDSSGLPSDIRLGMHAYDRSYSQLHVAVGRCNLSISASGGSELRLLVEQVPSANASANASTNASANASADPCEGLLLVLIGLSTWYRANRVSSDGASHLSFASYGLGTSHVRSTRPADAAHAPLKPAVAAAPHLAFHLREGFRLGLYSGDTTSSLEVVTAALQAARLRELGTYARYGKLAETKMVVQAAVMWQFIWNPLEQGPFAPVIRGDPQGLSPFTLTLHPHPSPFTLHPLPSPITHRPSPSPSPSPFTLTLHPHPSPFTLHPLPFTHHPSPSPLTHHPSLSPLTHHPSPSPSPSPITLTLTLTIHPRQPLGAR